MSEQLIMKCSNDFCSVENDKGTRLVICKPPWSDWWQYSISRKNSQEVLKYTPFKYGVDYATQDDAFMALKEVVEDMAPHIELLLEQQTTTTRN